MDKEYFQYNIRNGFTCFYDGALNYIETSSTSIPGTAKSFIPRNISELSNRDDVKYMRVSGYNAEIGIYERPIEKCIDITTKYADEKLINLKAPIDLDIFLPTEFYVLKGKTIEIYNSSLIPYPTTEGLYFNWNCSQTNGQNTIKIGDNYNDKFVIKTNSNTATGTYTVELEVYDKYYNKLYYGISTLYVVNLLSVNKAIVPIGDSLTNSKPWLGYIKSESNDKISFIGTRYSNNASYESYNIHHEGRSGVRASWYTANSTYNYNDGIIDETGNPRKNPFWNSSTSKFSFKYYNTTYNFNPDGVQFLLGTNGLNTAPATEENAIYDMINIIRTEKDDNNNLLYANMPIFICYPIYTSSQDGCGNYSGSDGNNESSMFYAYKKLAMWNFIRRLNIRLKNFEHIYFIPLAQTFDHENMFGFIKIPINPYSEITKKVPADAIHPDISGYQLFKDNMLAVYSQVFS